jgi:hypothetical protein
MVDYSNGLEPQVNATMMWITLCFILSIGPAFLLVLAQNISVPMDYFCTRLGHSSKCQVGANTAAWSLLYQPPGWTMQFISLAVVETCHTLEASSGMVSAKMQLLEPLE